MVTYHQVTKLRKVNIFANGHSSDQQYGDQERKYAQQCF